MGSRLLGACLGVAAVEAGCSLVIDPDLSPIDESGHLECRANDQCDDADACTDDVCRDGQCVHSPRDDDGDGFGREQCGGNDCDDSDPEVKPSALERCDDGEDQDCDDLVDLDDDDCGPGPDNDLCSTAFSLPIDDGGGRVRIVGDTSLRSHQDEPSCARGGGIGAPDVFFLLALDTPREVMVDTFESEFDTVLEIRTVCEDPAFDLACSGDVNANSDSRIVLRTAPATDLYVLLDGDERDPSGRYALSYSVRPVRPQLGCEAPMDITGGAAVYGETSFDSFEDNFQGSCGGEASSEEVFRIDVTKPSVLTAVTHASGFDTVFYVRSTLCAGGEEIDCRDIPGGTEETALNLGPGTHYLFLDGAAGDEGAYRLGVKID
jgi:hypothetical protein